MEAHPTTQVETPVKINVNIRDQGLSSPQQHSMSSPQVESPMSEHQHPLHVSTAYSTSPEPQAPVSRDGQSIESPPAPMESPVSEGQVPISFPHPTSPHQDVIMRGMPLPTSPHQEAMMRNVQMSPTQEDMIRSLPTSPTQEDMMRIAHPTSPDELIKRQETFSSGQQAQMMYSRPPAQRKSTHIEVIPCKICGDKSSGVHYGVITCEGCKGFFRRSQAGPVNYQCPRNKNCVIDRVNRNRCQYCRLQKCLQLGMSRDAVKFGRMSKKQREKVEDEANFHKRNRMNGISDPLPYPNGQTPTTNNNQYPSYSQPQYQFSPNGYGGTYPTYSQLPMDGNSYTAQAEIGQQGEEIDLGSLTKGIADAHARTCLFTNDQIEKMRGMTVSQEIVDMYRNMSHEKLWVEIAEKVTMTVQQIIEFSKMVPGFMNLLQDDQIMLLKGGSFEIALLRLCRAFDINTNSVIFGNAFVPLEAFSSLNEEEAIVMVQIFEFAKDMIALNLTENELALLCAVVLIDPNRPGVRDASIVEKLSERIEAALKMEVGLAHPDDDLFKTKLIERIPKLRDLSCKHIEILNKFKQANPGVDFPALHKELFSTDGSA